MCFSKYGIGCCQFNIRHVAEDGVILWKTRREGATFMLAGFSPRPARCVAHLSTGRIVVGGTPATAEDRTLVDCYTSAGVRVWSEGYADLLAQPTGDLPTEFDSDHLEWTVTAITATPDDTLVFVAHRRRGLSPTTGLSYRLIEIDADGAVLAQTAILDATIAGIRSGPSGEIVYWTGNGTTGSVGVWSADRSTRTAVPSLTFSIADAFIRASDGNLVIGTNGSQLFGGQRIALWTLAGSEVWGLIVGSVGLGTQGVVNVNELSTGKLIVSGSMSISSSLKRLIRLSSSGSYEADLNPAEWGSNQYTQQSRVDTANDNLVLTAATSTPWDVSRRDSAAVKLWAHYIPYAGDLVAQPGPNSRVTVLSETSPSKLEELFL